MCGLDQCPDATGPWVLRAWACLPDVPGPVEAHHPADDAEAEVDGEDDVSERYEHDIDREDEYPHCRLCKLTTDDEGRMDFECPARLRQALDAAEAQLSAADRMRLMAAKFIDAQPARAEGSLDLMLACVEYERLRLNP